MTETLVSRYEIHPASPLIGAEISGVDLPETAASLLIDIRPEAHAVGGSHAQRDVIDLTLIAAAARSGQAALARALVSERTARKPPAAASARALVLANGGDETWLRWQPHARTEQEGQRAAADSR